MNDEPEDGEKAADSYTSFADGYLRSRAAFREKARHEFSSRDPRLTVVLDAAGELISAQTLFLSGRDLRIVDGGVHFGSLIVSYCRTHFIAADLIRQCELIEAAVLIRKQMELIARLYELGRGERSDLEGKTPNVKWLQTQMKRLYGEVSAIAHSAKEEPLALLGWHTADGNVYRHLYPEFDDNAYAAAQQLSLLALDFHIPCQAFCKKVAPSETAPNAELVYRFLLSTLTHNSP